MKNYSTANPLVHAAYNSDAFVAVDLIELHLTNINKASAPIYLCNGGFDISFDSPSAPDAGQNVYAAQGEFIGFSTVEEDFDVKVGKFNIYLSALNNTYVQQFVYQDPVTGARIDLEGRRVVIYKAFLDRNNDFAITGSPIVIFDGIIYNIQVSESAASAQLTIECATLFSDFERNSGRKTNNGSNWVFQGNTYDTSFGQAGFVGNTEYKWGKA
jgi:hypothetical protein